jgi:eukaryotic-like serine/threonine-protein kinase
MNLSARFAAAPISNRYEISERPIGMGARSYVYRAFDLNKNMIVALKTLRFEEDCVYLKREFRSLQEIYHPNLAQLYDLQVDDENYFFTMELIEGTDFVSFVRRSQDRQVGPTLDFTSVRIALGHLINGLTALHAARTIHRDIKPTNVLVEPTGRAVLVDFGLAADLSTRQPGNADDKQRIGGIPYYDEQSNAGTLYYMAPERLELMGGSATEASDWYSVGAMLYEALVGVVPFRVEWRGNPVQQCAALREAQKQPPKPPHKADQRIPRDLSELSLALLRRDPRTRPTGAEMLKLASPAVRTDSASHYAIFLDRGREFFVGRAKEEEQLRRAFTNSIQKNVTVLVEGVSGAGKTTLIEHFASSAYDSEGALVLRSRCHPHEMIKYNALDGLIDNLSRFLCLRPSYLASVIPEHLSALFKVFPVLARVPFQKPTKLPELAMDPHVVMRDAMKGLRELLIEVTKEQPLIVWIDDAQWCDSASVSLLREAFMHPQAPGSLLIISFRSEDRDSKIISLLSDSSGMPSPFEHCTLSPMQEEEIRSLIAKVGGVTYNNDDAIMRQIRDDTGGLPLFIKEWAYRFRALKDINATAKINVSSLLKERILSLPESLRSLLEIVAVSSRPLEEGVLMEVAGGTGAKAAGLYRLSREHILRKTMVDGQWSLESYHDRIRQIVLSLLNADALRRIHRGIAEALKTRLDTDPEILVEHYLGAENQVAAAQHAIVGGHRAAERLSFDRAAELFGLAVRLRGDRVEDWNLLEEQAQALANAARTKEAAETYEKAAENAGLMQCKPKKQALTLKAAEQFLTGGVLPQGLLFLGKVFGDLKLRFPPRWPRITSIGNRLRFLWRILLRNQLGALSNFGLNRQSETPPEVLLRLDTLWVASRSMVMLDYVVGEAMTSWYLTEAVRQRDRSCLLRALGLEASIYAAIGWPLCRRGSATFLLQARKLLRDSQDPYDHAYLKLCRASIAWLVGKWRTCADLAENTVSQLSECTGVNWDLAITRGFGLSAQVFLGELRTLAQKMPELLADADRRGDHYMGTVFRSGYLVFLPLADDRPDDALKDAEETIRNVPPDRFTAFHFHHFNAATNASLYAGNVWEAWSLIEQRWPLMKKSGLLRLGCIGSLLREIRARAALAAARQKPTKNFANWTTSRLLALALKEADKIAVQSLPHANPMAAGIRAGAAAIEGYDFRKEAALREAVSGFKTAKMSLHHAAGSLCLGNLLGGDEGRQLVATSKRFFTSQGVRNPEAMTALLFPGAT